MDSKKEKEFEIAVDWGMYGTVRIKAETLERAIHIANHDESICLPDGEYIDSSFRANQEVTEYLNSLKKIVKKTEKIK